MAGKESLRKSLIMLCGWSEQDNPNIVPITDIDLNKTDAVVFSHFGVVSGIYSIVRGEVDKYTWQEVGSSFLPGELIAF